MRPSDRVWSLRLRPPCSVSWHSSLFSYFFLFLLYSPFSSFSPLNSPSRRKEEETFFLSLSEKFLIELLSTFFSLSLSISSFHVSIRAPLLCPSIFSFFVLLLWLFVLSIFLPSHWSREEGKNTHEKKPYVIFFSYLCWFVEIEKNV